MSFHEELRRIRVERGLKQKEVAAKIGVSEPTYSMYEKGTREPNVSKLREIAAALNVSADQLLGLAPASSPAAEIPSNAVFLANFSAEEIEMLNSVFNAGYLIPPKLLLQIILLYINLNTSSRAQIVSHMLEDYSPNAVSLANLPQPDTEHIQRAVKLILDYMDSYE